MPAPTSTESSTMAASRRCPTKKPRVHSSRMMPAAESADQRSSGVNAGLCSRFASGAAPSHKDATATAADSTETTASARARVL